MRRRAPLLLAAAFALLAIATAAVLTGSDAGSGRTSPAKPATAAAFSLPDLRGSSQPVSLPTGKPAIVNFLASWCVPCREELPLLQAVERRHGRTVAVVGIDHQDSKTGAVELLADIGVTFPVGYDPQGTVGARYRLRGMPTTVFVDARGREVGRIAGRLRADDLDMWVERLTTVESGRP